MSNDLLQRKVCIKCGRKRIAERMEIFGTVDGVTHWVCKQKDFNWWRYSNDEKCTPLPGSLYMRFRNLVTVLLNSFEQTGDPIAVASIEGKAKGSDKSAAVEKSGGVAVVSRKGRRRGRP